AQRRTAEYALLAVAGGLLAMLLFRQAAPPGATRPGDPWAGARPAVAGASPPVGGASAGMPSAGIGGSLTDLERETARALEAVLSRIQGAGAVTVEVTLEGAPEQVFAQDHQLNRTVTREGGEGGVTRTVEQLDASDRLVTVQAAAAGQAPVVQQMRRPAVRGVLVVAEGADDPSVQAALARAVEVALAVPAHRVAVVSGRGGADR
ncbi:MAG: hypothetical protein IRY95_05920, partial [Clostridia bacterium]|nr:hypothetical protein [Clostridia bacterium]